MSRSRNWILGTVAAIVFIGIPLITWFARFWTDYLWFESLGQQDVFVARLVSQLVVGTAFAILTFLIVFINLRVARAMAPKALLTSVGDVNPQLEEFIVQVRVKSGPILDRLVFLGSAAIAVLIGLSLSSQWDVLRLALERVPFGQTDPQFNMDIGFYVFTLPASEDRHRLALRHPRAHAHPHHRPRSGRWGDPAASAVQGVRPTREGTRLGPARAHRCEQGVRLLPQDLRTQLLAERTGDRRFLHRRERSAPGAPHPHRDRDRVGGHPAAQHPGEGLASAHHRGGCVARGLDPHRRHLPRAHPAASRATQRDRCRGTVYRAQHLGHPRGVRPGRDRDPGLPRERGPDRPRRPRQPRHARERASLGPVDHHASHTASCRSSGRTTTSTMWTSIGTRWTRTGGRC